MTALVGAVVVNHNGGDLTMRCLDSLLATDWPAECLQMVLVDNDSHDGIANRVKAELPKVRVLELGKNIGFGGACNHAIAELDRVDYVALVNNDACVEPSWLAPLAHALESEPDLGAASPKILFDGRFVDVFVDSPVHRRGRGDHRGLGVRISGVRLDGDDGWSGTQLVDGFWGIEHDPSDGSPFEWTNGAGHLRVRARPDDTLPACFLRLSADDKCSVRVRSGAHEVEHVVGPDPAWFDAPLDGDPFEVVNNAGSVLLSDGHGADRGYLERDSTGRFDETEEVFAWCGAGVLMSRRYLDSVGDFEQSYFLYYEDLDLSWRARAAGWRHVYVPQSKIRHVHSASTVEGSALFDHYVERNRLLTLVRNAPARLACWAAVRHLLVTASYVRRDALSPLARGAAPSVETPMRRLRSFGAFVLKLPAALQARRRLRRRQIVRDDELLAWMVKTPR
jgi:GT2 family glycosyltransferase